MQFKLSGASFKRALIGILGGSSKKAVNFTFTQGLLRLQSNDVIVVEDFVEVLEQDTTSHSFTAIINNTIQLIHSKMNVIVQISGDKLTIIQNDFQYNVDREYMEAVEYKTPELSTSILKVQDLVVLDKDLKALEAVTKLYGSSNINVYISDGVICSKAGDIAYIATMDLCDMSLSNQIIKTLCKSIKDDVTYIKEDNVLSCFDAGRRLLVNVGKTDKQTINGIKKICNECKPLVEGFSLSSYKQTVEILHKVYPNTIVNLSVCKNGFIIYANNEIANIKVGLGTKPLCTIQISMQQLMSLFKILGEDTVDIYGGNNKICVKQRYSSYNKILILAGILY
ncbi:MAG: hypothetical protein IJE43_19450 [Alphaproteobacteria bacterium]|nr:hypothetical protein [Alphaproteobacteria bacterium]